MRKLTFAKKVAVATTLEQAMELWDEAYWKNPSPEMNRSEVLAFAKALSFVADTKDLDDLVWNRFECHGCSASSWRQHIRMVFDRADEIENGN